VDSGQIGLNAAAWLATYAIHSTVLLGGALVMERALSRGSEAWLETLWRAALFGPLLTSTLQLAGMAPHTWRMELASGGAGAGSTPIHIGGLLLEGRAASVPGTVVFAGLVVYLVVVVARLAGFFMTRRSLRRLLSDRSAIADRMVAARVQRFSRGMSVKISASSRISTPIVVSRDELCLPWRAVSGLPPDELDAVLAHEIAHLRRRDGAWLWGMLLAERILWIQPLNRLAVSRLHRLAECFCDDWALGRSVPPVALASALTRVAGWMRITPATRVAVGMASNESLAVTRVRRILDPDRPRGDKPSRRVTIALAIVLVAGMTAVGPGFAAAVAAHYTITAHDDGGPFTVTLRDARVVAMTMDGAPVAQSRIHHVGNRVIVDGAGPAGRLELTIKPGGGISWMSRPQRAPRQPR
jgi:beta-lactamase regulating signal transducer with metallopeptidase domain